MKKFCGLTVTGVLLQQHQQCLWREERGQSMVLAALRNDDTGETGHIVYGCDVDKRDIEEEDIYTDNEAFAKIFEDAAVADHVDYQELFAMADETTPKERTEEIDEILGECWNGTQVPSGNDYY